MPVVRLSIRLEEGVAKALEEFLVFVLVLFGHDYERGRGKAVLDGILAAGLLAGFRLGSAFEAVAAIGCELSI